MDIKPLIAALPEHYTPGEAAVTERVLREYGGTIPVAGIKRTARRVDFPASVRNT